VETHKDQRDRRVTRVTATERGRMIRETVLGRRRELLADVLARVGPLDPATEAAIELIGASFRPYA
jgi:DNA-binding MarR family transcriptional regulator